MKALAYVKNVPGKPLSDFADNFILVFDLTSMQEATEIFVHPELTNSSSSVELKICTALKKNIENIFLGEKSSTGYNDSAKNVSENLPPMIAY